MSIKNLISFFIIFLLSSKTELYAQVDEDIFTKTKVEAIKKLNNNPLPDSNRINALRDLVTLPNMFFLKQKKEVKQYCDELIILSKKLNDKVALGNAYEFFGWYYKAARDYDRAIIYLDSAIKLGSNTNDKFLIARKNRALKIQGVIYNGIEDYTKALNTSFESLIYYENINSISKVEIYSLVGNIYYVLKNYEKSVYYITKYMESSYTQNDPDAVFVAYSQLIKVLIAKNDLETPKNYFKRQNLLLNKVDSFYWGGFYRNYGLYYMKINKFDSSYLYLKKALFAENEFPHSTPLNEIQGYMSYVLLQLKKFSEAKEYIDLNLITSKNANEKENQIVAFKNASSYYESVQDYNTAYRYLNDAIRLNDSLFEQNAVKQNNAFATIYETEKLQRDGLRNQLIFQKKEDSLKLMQVNTDAILFKQQFLNKEQAQNILLQNNELLLNKQTILNSNQQLSILNKDKELQHLVFLKTQANLQTEQLQNSEKEKELTLVQKEKLLQSAQVKSLSQENELSKLKQRQLLFYGIAGFGLLLFTGIYFFNRNKAKQAQLKMELEKKEAEFQRSLADVSMSALRSQMNPHFIFNCLNSIKLYTTQNDNVAAANYLTKFSKLIRMALENSRSETVTLSAELESLELYIQMEAMRFKEKLKYSIAIDKNVDSSFIEIPPMLLQPYVENAIWHGLMHREDGGRIDVGVRVIPNESTLAITIKDNGVGREKAAQLKSKTATSHKSYGTKVTGERLDLINQIYKTGASVTTEDLTNNGEVTGTLVTIKIPFE